MKEIEEHVGHLRIKGNLFRFRRNWKNIVLFPHHQRIIQKMPANCIEAICSDLIGEFLQFSLPLLFREFIEIFRIRKQPVWNKIEAVQADSATRSLGECESPVRTGGNSAESSGRRSCFTQIKCRIAKNRRRQRNRAPFAICHNRQRGGSCAAHFLIGYGNSDHNPAASAGSL